MITKDSALWFVHFLSKIWANFLPNCMLRYKNIKTVFCEQSQRVILWQTLLLKVKWQNAIHRRLMESFSNCVSLITSVWIQQTSPRFWSGLTLDVVGCCAVTSLILRTLVTELTRDCFPKNIIDDDIFEQRLMAIMLKTKQPAIATDNGWPLLDQ